jgi:flagellin
MKYNGQALFGAGTLDGVMLTNGDTIATIAASRATNGARQSSLQFDSQANASTQTTEQAAAGQISNVDVAAESTNLAKFNVMVQYGAAMLAQANQSTQVALKLIQ